MANITKVYLLNVPLKSDYQHTYYFDDEEAQTSFFTSKRITDLSFTDFNYQRKDNIIRVPAHIDSLYKANYVMYQNTAISNKWFYAFIKDMKYINDERTDITIETDVMQTWLFDYKIGKCFVEREHVAFDIAGSNTVPEGLELGEYISTSHQLINFSDVVIVIGATWTPKDDTTGIGGDRVGSMCHGIYTGIHYFAYSTDSVGISKLNDLLTTYAKEGKNDAIVCMFLAPKRLISEETINQYVLRCASNPYSPYSLCINYDDNTDYSSNIEMTFDNKLGRYESKVRNKKLYTFPYCYLMASNNCGVDAVYKYEDFRDSQNTVRLPKFTVNGCLTPGCSIRLVPYEYKGILANNESEGINLGKFPALNWTSDYFTNWLTQNAVNIGIQAVTGIGSIIGGAYAKDAGSITTGVNSIINSVGSIYQANLTPNQSSGNINSGDVITATGQNDFHFYQMCIKPEYANIIDEFFDMYGYKINRVKIPESSHRNKYWYTKTIDANITGAFPENDLQKIRECYNKGITFWRTKTALEGENITVGEYGINETTMH